jgi:hypothetical protein
MAAMVGGCTIPPIRSDLHEPTTDANRGYALLSFGPASAQHYTTHYNIRLANQANSEVVSILFTTGSLLVKPTEVDFSNRQGHGAVYLVELPAGAYYVERFRVYTPEAYSSIADIPFAIKPGQITYLGRFLVVREASVSARRLNTFQEDLDIAKKKYEAEVKKNGIDPVVPALGMEL